MGGKKYVPQNVILVCDKGTKPSKLLSFSNIEVSIIDENMCTKADKTVSVNFQPFGSCSCKKGKPCVPAVTDWTNLSDSISIGSNELLLEDSELPCTVGGTIKIFYSMQAASVYLPEPEEEDEGFWETTWSFTKGVGSGLWKGAKGTVVGAKDLAVWAGKHTPPYILLNPEGYLEQLQKDKDTIVSIGSAAKKAGIWAHRSGPINYIANPEDWAAQQADNKEAFDNLIAKAREMDAEEWGDLAGQGLFEVGLGVATAGVGTAGTTLKAADKSLDVVKAVNTIDNLVDGAKVLENTDDVIDGVKALDKIEDSVKLPPVPDELGDVVNVKRSIFTSEEILGRKVFKNSRDVTPDKPSFVDDSVNKSIRDKVDDGWTNKDLMSEGYAPIGPDGKQINLHHLTGEEPGTMVELTTSFHKKHHKPLHGLVEDGASFRNDPKLEYQYNKFRKNYWKQRANDF